MSQTPVGTLVHSGVWLCQMGGYRCTLECDQRTIFPDLICKLRPEAAIAGLDRVSISAHAV